MIKKDIDKIDRIHRGFTAKFRGLKDVDYLKKLEMLNTNSLERRREVFFINAWQQIKDKIENV